MAHRTPNNPAIDSAAPGAASKSDTFTLSNHSEHTKTKQPSSTFTKKIFLTLLSIAVVIHQLKTNDQQFLMDATDDQQYQTNTAVPKEEEQTSIVYPINQATCPPKADLTKYSQTKLVRPPEERNDWNRCFRFECNKNATECDNGDYPTNYNGAQPPCCTHIMRDFAIEFDRILCHYGIEYYPAYGTLLGLIRADRLIPWTSDNDFIMTYQGIALLNEIWDRSEQELNHGLRLLFQLHVTRVCAGPNFAQGQLKKWPSKQQKEKNQQYNKQAQQQVYSSSKEEYYNVCPYNDLYHSKDLGNGKWKDYQGCQHIVREASLPIPMRKPVYNGSFYVNMMHGAEETLEHIYGKNWRYPDASGKSHGHTHCGYK